MTTDNAIAVLRRMQEPDPFEPQITQTAFDALEMAIDMIERYSTWSQTYSNMVEDTISRQAALELVRDVCDAIMSCCESHCDEETGYEVYDDVREISAILKCNKEIRIALKNMPSALPLLNQATISEDRCGECDAWNKYKNYPSAQPNSKDLVEKIKNGITASDGNSEYFIGLRNGMRWCLSLIDDKEPLYEYCPSAHSEMTATSNTVASNTVKIPVMDGVTDTISRQAAIDYCYQLINVEHQQGSDEMNYGQERVNQTETILHHLEFMPSAQSERQWIPCSERLPDTPIRVQVQLDNGWIITAYRQEDEWLSVPDCEEALHDEWVVAWMPLPEPWRGEEHG